MEQRIWENPVVGTRYVPISHALIAGTSSGAADTVLTVRANVALVVRKLVAVNTDSSARTLSLHSVPSGGSISTGNTEIDALSIAANTAVDLTDYIGGLYDTGTTLEAWASLTNVVVLHGWGEEIL